MAERKPIFSVGSMVLAIINVFVVFLAVELLMGDMNLNLGVDTMTALLYGFIICTLLSLVSLAMGIAAFVRKESMKLMGGVAIGLSLFILVPAAIGWFGA